MFSAEEEEEEEGWTIKLSSRHGANVPHRPR